MIGGAVVLGTGGVERVFFALLVVAVMCLVLVGFTLPETAQCLVENGSVPAPGVWRTWWSVLQSNGTPGPDRLGTSGVTERGRRPAWRLASAFAAFRIIFYKGVQKKIGAGRVHREEFFGQLFCHPL